MMKLKTFGLRTAEAKLALAKGKIHDAIRAAPLSTDQRYHQHSKHLLAVFDKYIAEQFGERCEDYEPDCCVCQIYKVRDDLKTFID